MEDFDVFCSKNLFFLSIPLRVLRQSINSCVSFALTIVNLEVVTRKFLGLADLSGVETLCVHKLAEVIKVGKYKYLMLRPF